MANDRFNMTDYIQLMKEANVRFGYSYVDFDTMLEQFNVSRLPDHENGAEPYIAYILMSKPTLNIRDRRMYASAYGENAYNNFVEFQRNAMTAAFTNDEYGKQLLLSMSEYSSNAWMPIITTKAKSYNVGDVELKTVEKGNTYYGHVLKYGKHSEDHKVSGTVSIDFRNDRYLSILKLMYLWMCYIYMVSKTSIIQPTLINQRNAILDYPASLYYLVTRRDGRELIYWEKLTGVFPTRAPMSIFSFNDNMILEDTVTVDFSYGIKSDPCDPSILMDINMLSGYDYDSIRELTQSGDNYYSRRTITNRENRTEKYNPYRRTLLNNEAPFVKGDIFANYPFIKMERRDGRLKYYLTWEV